MITNRKAKWNPGQKKIQDIVKMEIFQLWPDSRLNFVFVGNTKKMRLN